MEIWQKIKSLYTGERKWFVYFVTFWLIYFTWSWLYGSGNTIFIWMDAKEEYRDKMEQISILDQKIEEMDREMTHRESNQDTLEKFAREQYLMAADDEDVYIIE